MKTSSPESMTRITYTGTESAEVFVKYHTSRRFYEGYWIPGKTFRLWGENRFHPCATKRDLVIFLASLPENLTP